MRITDLDGRVYDVPDEILERYEVNSAEEALASLNGKPSRQAAGAVVAPGPIRQQGRLQDGRGEDE